MTFDDVISSLEKAPLKPSLPNKSFLEMTEPLPRPKEKVKAMEKHKPGSIAKAFATHPQTPDRIEKTQQEISTLLPAKVEYKLDTSDFEDVKTRLSELQNRHKIDGGKVDRPVLRKASHAGSDDTPVASDTDDHPTLKRRNADSTQN